jgi:hypothetical protein
MSDYQSDGWTENPFTFSASRQVPDTEGVPIPITGILRDLLERIKVKFMRMPPAKILPLEPVATTQWTPELGMSQTLADRFAPNPAFIGLPLRRKDIETTQGTKGFNTHYNLILDQSSSMNSLSYTIPESGIGLNRSLVCRIASACLISQASYNLDSFTIFSYNDTGKVVWPVPEGGPSFDYQDAVAYLTSDGINTLFNSITNKGSISNNADNEMLLDALSAIHPTGYTNFDSAYEITIDVCEKHSISTMITVFITDGERLSEMITQGSSVTGGLSYDEWFRQGQNKLFYILIDSAGSSSLKKEYKKVVTELMQLYNYPREIAEKFVWMFPDDGMVDPETGEAMTDIMEQMAWLFTEIGKIYAGTSEYFQDIVDFMEENPSDEAKP